ncbi:MAG TPA: hypothetical protein VNO32_09365, partial [Candidatus Acidoferrum sp.]|nr:hypothetical protein [Candidatus Acidoferrum sp.]
QIPAHYQMKVRKRTAEEDPRQQVTHIYNLTGAQARVNIQSADSSVNISSKFFDINIMQTLFADPLPARLSQVWGVPAIASSMQANYPASGRTPKLYLT